MDCGENENDEALLSMIGAGTLGARVDGELTPSCGHGECYLVPNEAETEFSIRTARFQSACQYLWSVSICLPAYKFECL